MVGLVLFATVVSFVTYHVIRYWQRRRAMPVGLPLGNDEDEIDVLPERPDRVWQSDPSDENVFFCHIPRRRNAGRHYYAGCEYSNLHMAILFFRRDREQNCLSSVYERIPYDH